MMQSRIFGIVTIIIIVVLVIAICYFNAREKAEETVLTCIDGDVINIAPYPALYHLHATFPTHVVQRTDHIMTVGPPETTGEEMQSPVFLSQQQALVIHGEIPRGYPYWGVTGYLYDLPVDGHFSSQSDRQIVYASIGDTVSSRTVESLAVGDAFAAVLTPNPLVFNEVKRVLLKEWKKVGRKHPMQVIPIYIPPNVYFEKARYLLRAKVVMRRSDAPIPPFQCKLYTSNLPPRPIPQQFLRDRSTSPKEQDSVSNEVWHSSALKALQAKNYELRRIIPVRRHLEHLFPDGLDNGAHQIFEVADHLQELPNANGNSRDITMFHSDVITLTPDESIVVVAVDHAMSRRSIYSAIQFAGVNGEDAPSEKGEVYAIHATGDIIERKYNTNSTIKAQMTLNSPPLTMYHNGVCTVRVTEQIYPDPLSHVGPHPNSVLPMKVFVIKRVEMSS